MTAAAVVRFDDIHRADPYIEAWCDGEVAFIDMVYVPHEMRRNGIATTLVKDWLSNLDSSVKRVKLMPVDHAAICFWSTFGFKKAYIGDYLYSEIENAMVLGVNGHSTPEPELILEGDEYRHWVE